MKTNRMQQVELRFYRLLRREAPQGRLARATFWLVAGYLLLWPLSLLPGAFGDSFGLLRSLDTFALMVASILLVWRWLTRRVLWSLSGKLVLTYLLIGLAPVVLFVTLAGLSAYVLAGQFAIYIASSRIHAELNHLDMENESYALHAAHLLMPPLRPRPTVANGTKILRSQSSLSPQQGLPDALILPELSRNEAMRSPGIHDMAAFLDGKKLPLLARNGEIFSSLTLPAWAQDGFHGLVLDDGKLYLRAVTKEMVHGRKLDFVSSMPVDKTLLDRLSVGLGRIIISPGIAISNNKNGTVSFNNQLVEQDLPAGDKGNTPVAAARSLGLSAEKDALLPQERTLTKEEVQRTTILGGELPVPESAYDHIVRFPSTMRTTDWHSGEVKNIALGVDSLPSLLYARLFDASLDMARIIRLALITIAFIFGLLELFALYMAIRLSRTITQSVTGLYEATLKIDHGDLSHKISVTRNDQLAELSKSFNRMTSSLEKLLDEQKEKERLQNELSIAQEVQANLFPQGDKGLVSLELHGICRPARAVSGDYYDFLLFNQDGRETGAGLAIGDISGKGISAALLMATLHSAVRAYRFASEELVYAESTMAALSGTNGLIVDSAETGELFESPGRILSLLNRHLYRSTQPEKYATLFLAHYNVLGARLTYSNAGQLPPLVLGNDGSVRRLDRGGTVVGLMDGMQYEEGSVQLHTGDILIGYSDGVTEPENDFGEFGEERLLEIVHQHRHKPLQTISDQVMQALDVWIGAQEQPDDITLILARQR
ncbi:MAG: PP2C family protein-serine/threonine phosphatase [Acidobacteriaceae bacterium]